MDILNFALELEKTSRDYYRQLANEAPNKGLAIVLTMLADEEVKHYWIISQMQSKIPIEPAQTTVLKDAKDVFARMAKSKERFDFGLDQVGLYRKAQEIEKKSEKFYAEKCRETPSEYEKRIFGLLADEEAKHNRLLENIIDFVSRPQQWLENAEWYHLEPY